MGMMKLAAETMRIFVQFDASFEALFPGKEKGRPEPSFF